MTTAEILQEAQKAATTLDGLAGYYGLRNYKREQEGKRKSPVDQAKYEAFSFAADEVKRLIEKATEEAQND